MNIFGFEIRKANNNAYDLSELLIRKCNKLQQENEHLFSRVELIEKQADTTHEILMNFLHGLADMREDSGHS